MLRYRPVLIEVPHFASLRGSEREVTILRSDNGQTWREHSTVASEEAVHDALEGSFSGRLVFRVVVVVLSMLDGKMRGRQIGGVFIALLQKPEVFWGRNAGNYSPNFSEWARFPRNIIISFYMFHTTTFFIVTVNSVKFLILQFNLFSLYTVLYVQLLFT